MKIHFLNPGSIDQISGGYIFNKHFVASLSANVDDFSLHELSNLEEWNQDSTDDSDVFIIDSLLFFKDHDVSKNFMQGRKVIPLIHLSEGLQHEKRIADEMSLLEGLNIIVTSEFVKTTLQRDYQLAPDKILVIEPGVAVLSKKEHYPDRIQHFICVSNLVKRKRILKLLQILNELKDYDWTLEIIGDAEIDVEYAQSILDFIQSQQLGDRVKVHAPMEQKKLFDLMRSKDMLLHLAVYETFGMCIFEAAAIGLPILSTKTGAWEDLRRYPLAGFIATDDLGAYKKALEHVLGSKFERVDEKVLHQSIYQWDDMAEKFIKWLS